EKVDVPELLKDLGFLVDFSVSGHMRLIHPDLIIEFLVPERGRGRDKPYPLPQLGLNAQSLRYLDLLEQNSMRFKTMGLEVNLPHPAAFALHKLIISKRRLKEEKRLRDSQSAFHILNCLIENGDCDIIKKIYDGLPKKWKTRILSTLEDPEEKDILALLDD
ncbi:MAG: GSU2403 family nucleotidyltransferase fold protein, partial [Candidatus Aminicenantaceae bacterium]